MGENIWRKTGDALGERIGSSVESGIRAGIEAALSGGSFGRSAMESIGSQVRDAMMGAIQGAINSTLFGAPVAGGSGDTGGAIEAVTGATGGSTGLIGRLLGSPLSFFGGGAGGILGGFGAIASLFGGGKRAATPMSGVQPIFGEGARYTGGGLDTLAGSDIFSKRLFSARNSGGDLFRKLAAARMAPEVVVHVKPSREFDAISEDKWVKTSKLNEIAGIPRRTNFNH